MSLSRRSLVTSVAALPALAVPVVALPAPKAEPTAIEKLWAEAKALRREFAVQDRLCDRLKEVLERRMPDPHPSIVWGGKNEADGLAYWVKDREPPYFKKYIFSGWIESKIEEASEPKFEKIVEYHNGREQVLTIISRSRGDAPFPFTDEQLALRDRLAARLELSRRYERKLKRVKKEIGLAAAEKKRDATCARQVDLDNKIVRMPATARRDLGIKLTIYKEYCTDMGEQEIMRDLERLTKHPNGLGMLAA